MTVRRGATIQERVPRGIRPLGALISLGEARRRALAAVAPLRRTEAVAVASSLRRVAAEEVRSPRDVPRTDRSAMDGYAVRAEDTSPAGPGGSVILRVQETLYASEVARKHVARGRCTAVATGSPLPRGADAVLMAERTTLEGTRVRVLRAVRPGENVSRRGSDIAKGAVVVRRGEWITPAKVGALAAIGRARVRVAAKPRVALLVTGDEIAAPGTRLRRGQVYDINSHTMASVVAENGGDPVVLGRVPDRMGALLAALRNALREDLVVVSGGSSVGEKDLVVDVVRSRGDVLFHGIAVKPGRPTLLGRVGAKAILGMPGNPTSCLSNAYVLLAPMVRRMARLPPAPERTVDVPLARRVRSAPGRTEIHTVRIEGGRAVPAFKDSGAITSMSRADGYIEIPADAEVVEAGQRVRVVLF